MSFSAEEMDDFAEDVKHWANKTKSDAISKMDELGIQASSKSKSRVPLRRAIKASVRKKDGMPDRISFKLPRYAIMRHKGVGRGTKITDVGTTPRTPAPFLNPVIEQNIDELADIVAERQGNLIVNALTIR